MRGTKLMTLSLLSAALCTGFASASPAQGGWRQWEIRLRDGRRLEANPLGAPDDAHLSLSVGAYEGPAGRIARDLVRAVVALPVPDSPSLAPVVARCEDVIVLRDGTTTVGRITLTRVRWSEGVVAQRGNTVDLRDVAYLVFAAPGPTNACPPKSTWQEPDGPYPIGRHQMPRPCSETCRT